MIRQSGSKSVKAGLAALFLVSLAPLLRGETAISPFILRYTTNTWTQNNNFQARVAVGTSTVVGGSTLTVGGIIESLVGGFKFPDGSIQTSASTVFSLSTGASVSGGNRNSIVFLDGSTKTATSTSLTYSATAGLSSSGADSSTQTIQSPASTDAASVTGNILLKTGNNSGIGSGGGTGSIVFDVGAITGIIAFPTNGIIDFRRNGTSYGNMDTSGIWTFNSIKDSALTSGRVPYAGTAGLLQDSSVFTFNGSTVAAPGVSVSSIAVTVGASSGKVLTSDANGVGTWQTVSASVSLTTGVAMGGGLANSTVYLDGSSKTATSANYSFNGTTETVKNIIASTVTIPGIYLTNSVSGGILYGGSTGLVTDSGVLSNGQLLIGDASGAPTAATLTQTANRVTVTNGAGTITLSGPQDIGTASTPQFAQIGVGVTPGNNGVYINRNPDLTSSDGSGLYNTSQFSNASGSRSAEGLLNEAYINTDGMTIGNLYGTASFATTYDGQANTLYGSYNRTLVVTGSTATTAYAEYIEPNYQTGAKMTNAYGIYLNNMNMGTIGSGAFTSLYISSITQPSHFAIKTESGNVVINSNNSATSSTTINGNLMMNKYETFTAVTSTPTASATLASIWAVTVSASAEMKVQDGAGNVTQISPHDQITGEWIYYSENTRTGRRVRVDMERMVRDIERITGNKYLDENMPLSEVKR